MTIVGLEPTNNIFGGNYEANHCFAALRPDGSACRRRLLHAGTADFGMLARAVKDSEKESLGTGYIEYMVASDAPAVSVNKNGDTPAY